MTPEWSFLTEIQVHQKILHHVICVLAVYFLIRIYKNVHQLTLEELNSQHTNDMVKD